MSGLLKNQFKNFMPNYVKEVSAFVKENADKVVDNITLSQLYGGLRDVTGLVTETSLLNPEDGIKFWGHSIEDIQNYHPKTPWNNKQPLAETVFVLLLTGKFPTEDVIVDLQQELHKRAKLPSYVSKILKDLPKNMTPMACFTALVAMLDHGSLFNKAYKDGAPKTELWEFAYEDALNLIATIPLLVTAIYEHLYDKKINKESDTSLDWAGNFAHLMGDKDTNNSSLLKDFFRLYMFLHSDHEGGNASANTAHIVGSTLASPYGSFAGGMHSLAGPLHGMATQNSLDWIDKMIQIAKNENKVLNKEFTDQYIHATLDSKQVVPGYGHAVLRKTDPRFTAQMKFAKDNNITSEQLETVWLVYSVAPDILGHIGKIKNPYPNVDSHSGALLNYFGIKDSHFFTVLFGASRCLGIMAQQIWDRSFMSPLHRPKSVTSSFIRDIVLKK